MSNDGVKCSRLQRSPEPITAEDVTELLRGAGAPEPWHCPAWIPLTATTLERTRQGILLFPGKRKRPRDLFQRGQAAVDELRRVLPQLIAFCERPFTAEQDGSVWQRARVRSLEEKRRMLDSLVDLAPRVRAVPLSGRWQDLAVSLAYSYRIIVSLEGASKDGPAVRFVSAALQLAGHGWHEPATIEKAIARGLRRSGPDKTNISDLSGDAP